MHDPESAAGWLRELNKPAAPCPLCEAPGCKRERYAVKFRAPTLSDPAHTETVLLHAEDKEDAAIASGFWGVVLDVKYRGGGA